MALKPTRKFAGAIIGFSLMQAAEQQMQIAACQLAIRLPLHGRRFGMTGQRGHNGTNQELRTYAEKLPPREVHSTFWRKTFFNSRNQKNCKVRGDHARAAHDRFRGA